MIPEEKNAAVARALLQAFDVTEIQDIRKMTKGLSSDLNFRIVVQGSPFLLRIMTRIDERNDPARQFACVNAAAEAGIAPHVRYTSIEDGICIVDFIEPAPFSRTEALARMPGLLRSLHALPPFPKTFNYVTAHNGFIWRFRTANILPKNEIEEAFTRYLQLCATYPRIDADMVSCHNDLKPENILFDGNRVWLVDWQAAFLNDRFFDLAVLANFVVIGDADEQIYLSGYFGHQPNDYERSRFFLMRQVMHMFYAAVFLMLASSGKPVNQNEDPPSFRAFHERIWSGEINLADNDTKITYARVHWAQLLHNIRQPRFDEALKSVTSPAAHLRLLPVA